jgi:gliding motility-associated-like protein
MIKKRLPLLFLIFLLTGTAARASHIVGGDFTYVYLGDTTISGVVKHKYRVSLYIYQDCVTGAAEAINDDNPAYITVYDNDKFPFTPPPLGWVQSDSVYYNPGSADGAITVPANFSNDCVSNIPTLCLLRKKFEKTYYLSANLNGYSVAYQRCCRNSSIVNVTDPGMKGATYFCVLPPASITNNSAVFKNYPPQIICLNNPMYYDNSATDADGDSLSYEFCDALVGASTDIIKPFRASPPPYDEAVQYYPPYTSQNPMSGFPAIQIDPRTGIITGTPNRVGRYLVSVCCSEWRNGVVINVVKREFQFVVTNCSKLVVADMPTFSTAPNTYIVNCANHTVQFKNTSTGGFSYKWDFGVESITSDVSAEFEPTYVYPDTGTFLVSLVVNPGSTCPDAIARLVKIYPEFHTAFTDSGNHCPGVPIYFQDKTTATIKPISYWSWSFGDSATSGDQNPVHVFAAGGTYNVLLASENIKNCRDTTLRRIVIQSFKPNAGDDTIIVKGEYIQFDAQGGTKYAWSPQLNLSDTSISNPRAFYPDTATYAYIVKVESSYGCVGYDTIKVQVVNYASFVVPNAFSPNGDGRNDVFRPHAVGYRSLKYFKVFNRWGEEVYNGNTLETGWDGTWGGKPGEIGVYFWEIGFVDRFGKDGTTKGDVTLIR